MRFLSPVPLRSRSLPSRRPLWLLAAVALVASAEVNASGQAPHSPESGAPFAWSKAAAPPAPGQSGTPGAWATSVPAAQLDLARQQAREQVDHVPPVAPAAHPGWQRRYTLGAGDTLNFSIFDRPDLSRQAVPIAPDGTISYLQAVAVKAEGRTIPELRHAMEQALSEYRKEPKVIVTPAAIGSKRFAIIGRVREPGSYALDRPLTILEAIAMAQGIEVGYVSGSSFEIADLERSFVARDGRKLDVDLAELYFEGKLAQNAHLEPDDYIYIASSLRNEIYVLGSVNNPGRFKMSTPLTVARAITLAGGYDRQAYKQRVLLVRGNIHKPDVQAVNVADILQGRAPDVPVQNRDIIFVDKRPFQIAERALDSAIFTFVQTVTAEAVNDGLRVNIPAQ